MIRLINSIGKCINKVNKNTHYDFTQKVKLFWVLFIVQLKAERGLPSNKPVKFLGFTVFFQSYEELLYLLDEIFLEFQYYFESDRLSPLIVDCGANIGISVLYFKWLYPKSRIIAFEPNPDAFHLLEKNVKQNHLENVQLYNVSLSDTDEERDFYINENTLLSSLDSGRGNTRKHKIWTRKLSNYLLGDHFDMVKVDVEGGEWEIISDLISTGTIQSVRRFIIEYHHKINNRPSKLSGFLRFFESNGFDYNIWSYYENDNFQDLLISASNLNHSNFSSIKKGISVLLCTHNGEALLANTLTSIAGQNVEDNLEWEVLLIDNDSDDNTVEVAAQIWSNLDVNVPFKIISEKQKGKSHAIDLGLDIAKYQYVIICDDDNWLDSNYLQIAYEIMMDNPQIGLLGGRGKAVFESDPPIWFRGYEEYYAVGKQKNYSGEVIQRSDEMRFIWGAGSVINMRAYRLLKMAGFTRIITQEKHPLLARSEDLELSLALQLTGYKLWYTDRLIYSHFIQKEKLSWDYLISITRPGARIRPYLRPYQMMIVGIDVYLQGGKYWKRYFRNWMYYMKHSIRSFSDLKYFVLAMLSYVVNEDFNYHQKYALWNEFYSILKVRKLYKRIQRQVFELKENIGRYQILDYSNNQLKESLRYFERDCCDLQELERESIKPPPLIQNGKSENSFETFEIANGK